MATPVLNVELRNINGKNKVPKARKAGKIPGVVYSRGETTKQILLDEKEMQKILSKYGQSMKIALNIEGERTFAVIKEIQRESIKNQLLHADFQTLDENEKIKMIMPIQIINREQVESSVRFIQTNISEVEIQTYPKYLPDKVELDATDLNTKDVLTISDLNIGQNENIEILEDKQKVVASFAYASSEAEVEDEEEV